MADDHPHRHMAASDLFLGFGLIPLPDAIDSFRFWAAEREALSGPERYALRLFDEVDMAALRGAYDAHEVRMAYLSSTNCFYVGFDHDDVPRGSDDELVLLQAETVVNRLVRLFDRIGEAEPSEEACSVLDLRAFQRTTQEVPALLEGAAERNPWACPGTVRCAPGGEWDVRTRIARACEAVAPITRLDCTFNCDAAAGLVAMRLVCPDETAMPHSCCDEETAQWQMLDVEQRGMLAREHACRMALVLAAAAFAAGMKIGRCSVEVRDSRRAERSFTLEFERSHFLSVYAPLSRTLARQPLRSGVCTRILEFERGASVLPAGGPDARWTRVDEDARPLPKALSELLLADTVCELNVMEPKDSPSMQRFSQIERIARAQPDRAVAELSQLVSELEAECALAELEADAPVQSQFCENSLDRLLIPLLEDDPDARVHRAPDALFYALHELSTLYTAAGDYDSALMAARELVDVAATSSQAHFALINVLAKLGRYQDVVEVCRHGMRVAYDRPSAAYYYYRLAFAYWALGDLQTALCCYRMVPLGQPISSTAQAEMRALMGKMHRQDPPTREEAEGVIALEGIPIMPEAAVSDQIANAAVLLTDNGIFPLAQGCVIYMWRIMGDDELGALSRSLQDPAGRR